MKNKALVAMSGGVDSSVSALLMMEKGYDCQGAIMDLLCGNKEKNADIEDAKRVAEILNIPFHVFDFKDDFRKYVIDYFVESYFKGETPNPCVECNKHLKFDSFMREMENLGCDYVVTGHYARIEYCEETGRYLLKKAVDEKKDQSYFLYGLNQYQLSHIRFPLGEMSKTDARDIAEKHGLITAHKSDSQDICFVPDGDYATIVKEYSDRDVVAGKFTDKNGNIYGDNKGIIHYTIGQRKGLGISADRPLYVINIDTETNNVILGDNEELFTQDVCATGINMIAVEDIPEPIRIQAKIRSRHNAQPGTAVIKNGVLHVHFDEPQRATTPGQALVLYDGDIVVGGGTIINV